MINSALPLNAVPIIMLSSLSRHGESVNSLGLTLSASSLRYSIISFTILSGRRIFLIRFVFTSDRICSLVTMLWPERHTSKTSEQSPLEANAAIITLESRTTLMKLF